MRPRKRILLETGSQSLKDQYTLILHTWGYAIARSQDEAAAVLAAGVPMDTVPLLVNQHWPLSVVVMVAQERWRQTAHSVGATLTAADHYVLREQIGIATARKRGPKPQPAPGATLAKAAA